MPFVLDASVTVPWFLPDEVTSYAESVLRRLGADRALAPAFWPTEVANALLLAERRGRTTSEATAAFLHRLRLLPIAVEPPSDDVVFGGLLALARDHGLTAYDAAYLELALREHVPLATQHDGLKAAAGRAGVPLLDGRR